MELPQPQFMPVKTTHIYNGIQHKFRFDNGYGASVITHDYSKGGIDQWELAVLDKEGQLTYDTPVTDDVIGYLSWNDVEKLLSTIENLPEQ